MTIDEFLSNLPAPERAALTRHAVARLLIQSTAKSVLLRKAPDPDLTEEEMASEVYRDVPDTDPKLQISNLGRLRRINKAGAFVDLQPYVTGKKGYRQVTYKDGKRKYVHQVVADVFELAKTSSDQVVVNHKNANPGDNRVSNLAWATQIENLEDAADNELFGYGDNKKDWSEDLKSALKKLHDSAEELSAPAKSGT